jgi:hypothetical protein
MLNKLERHVEQEEARWRRQLQLKEEELATVSAERDALHLELQQCDQYEQRNDILKVYIMKLVFITLQKIKQKFSLHNILI